jgi:hypothetical protein
VSRTFINVQRTLSRMLINYKRTTYGVPYVYHKRTPYGFLQKKDIGGFWAG